MPPIANFNPNVVQVQPSGVVADANNLASALIAMQSAVTAAVADATAYETQQGVPSFDTQGLSQRYSAAASAASVVVAGVQALAGKLAASEVENALLRQQIASSRADKSADKGVVKTGEQPAPPAGEKKTSAVVVGVISGIAGLVVGTGVGYAAHGAMKG